MSQLRTSPASVEIGPHETFSLGIDFTHSLLSGETPDASGAPTAILYDQTDDDDDVSATSLVGSPSVDGNIVIPVLTELTINHTYRLVTIIHPNAIDYRESVTLIVCTE